MTPAEQLLQRLRNVHPVKPSTWTALCPAHADRTPSLSITEVNNGTLLLKCWAGCSTKEIVGAVDLELRDLFHSRKEAYRTGPSRRAIDFERMIYRIGKSQIAGGAELSFSDRERFQLAQDRLASLGALP